MTEPAPVRDDRGARLAAIQEALAAGSLRGADRMVDALHPAEVAHLLESLPPAQRAVAWQLVDADSQGDVLVELSEEVRSELRRGHGRQRTRRRDRGPAVDDLADLLAELPEAVTRQVLRSMDQRDRERVSSLLAYPEDRAGGLMNTDTVTVRADVPMDVVMRYLRMRGELPERTDCLFVVDRHDRYLGALPLMRLLTAEPEALASTGMDPEASPIAPETPAHEVARCSSPAT